MELESSDFRIDFGVLPIPNGFLMHPEFIEDDIRQDLRFFWGTNDQREIGD